MWALRKRPSQLKKEDNALLKRLFEHSPLLKEAYQYPYQLTKLFDVNITRQVAARRMRRWVNRVQSCGLTCFDKFIKTLANYSQLLQ
ncbi:MAG: transposase [Gammaproteobacteria bacterium]|nr:transposase [Gammaproteobacteria bacterium]